MGIGTSLLLIAIGAILRFAVSVSTHGFSIQTIGLILMIVGAVGLFLSLLWVAVWRDRGERGTAYAGRDVPPGYGERGAPPSYGGRDVPPRYGERDAPPAGGY